MSVDLRHMRHFVAVAEELHFGRAAKRLKIAQPPLSQSIRRLENDLGVVLFARSRRGVALTAAGQIFLREARATLAQANLATKLARRAAETRQEVRLGFIGPALYRFLPDMLVQFTVAHPDISVRLFEQPSPAQMQALTAGDIDVGFLAEESQNDGACETLIVERAPLVAAMPSHWPLAKRASVSLAELAEYPFILPPTQKYTDNPNEMLALFTKAGVLPTITQESTHAQTTISLVAAGLGYSLITATATLTTPRKVAFVPIEEFGGQPQWGIMMAWKPAHLTDASAAFVAFASRYVDKHPEYQTFAFGDG